MVAECVGIMPSMSDATDIAAIDAALAKPASQAADGVSESNRSASDFIALQNHRRALAAANDPAAFFRGMTCKIVAPGGP